jgi:tyrosyl-tRNA synthetase
VALQADVELGGTDQKFNLLMGRTMQRKMGMEEQVILMMPLLEGLDGVNKMSKSLDNYIGIDEPACEYVKGELTGMFKKVMSLPDELIERYYELLSRISLEELESLKEKLRNNTVDPRDAKKKLAVELSTRYHGEKEAENALREYERILEKKDVGSSNSAFPTMKISASGEEKANWLPKIMKKTGLASSTSEAMRLIRQGGVKLNESIVTDTNETLSRGEYIIKVGKRRFYKVLIDS